MRPRIFRSRPTGGDIDLPRLRRLRTPRPDRRAGITPYPIPDSREAGRPPAELREKPREVFTFSAISFFLTLSRPGFGGAVNPQPKYKYDHG